MLPRTRYMDLIIAHCYTFLYNWTGAVWMIGYMHSVTEPSYWDWCYMVVRICMQMVINPLKRKRLARNCRLDL